MSSSKVESKVQSKVWKINFWKWIKDNEEKLKPPICNYMLYDEGEFWIMVVGGGKSNTRSDYHLNHGEEFFFQLKGDMVLKTVQEINGKKEFINVTIKEGEMLLLPGDTPHSPQRVADTVGLVIERKRAKDELDGVRWYCEKCKAVVYEEHFFCTDLGSQLVPVIKKYYASDKIRTCKGCGHVQTVPTDLNDGRKFNA